MSGLSWYQPLSPVSPTLLPRPPLPFSPYDVFLASDSTQRPPCQPLPQWNATDSFHSSGHTLKQRKTATPSVCRFSPSCTFLPFPQTIYHFKRVDGPPARTPGSGRFEEITGHITRILRLYSLPARISLQIDRRMDASTCGTPKPSNTTSTGLSIIHGKTILFWFSRGSEEICCLEESM